MSKANELIDELYALRAGMSVLSMQYDKYFEKQCEIDKIFAEMAKGLKSVLGEQFNGSSVGLGWLNREYIYFGIEEDSETKTARLDYRSNDNSNSGSTHEMFWKCLLGERCYFKLSEYRANNKHYEQLENILSEYNYSKTFGKAGYRDDHNYYDWVDSFVDSGANNIFARDRLIEITKDKTGAGSDENWKHLSRIDGFLYDLLIGKWMFTDECLIHFKTKINEIKELYNLISSDNEKLKPRGFFGRLFQGEYVRTEIQQNETRLNFANIAIGNAGNAVKYIETVVPKSKAEIASTKEKIACIKNDYESIYMALQAEYSSVIDLRDWENIDLIIYFLETGRADTVKEALQQVDMEKRTDRIVQTINDAAKKICNTIAIGIVTLNESIMKLESRITEQNVLLMQQNLEIAKLVSVTNMNNALLAKQNISSEKLMKEIKSFKALN